MGVRRLRPLFEMACEKKFLAGLLYFGFATSGLMAGVRDRPQVLVEGGKAQAVIVLGENADPFYRFVGEELQRYIQAITGTRIEIVTATQAASRPEGLLVLIGGPKANSLVEKAVNKKQVKFSDLKADGFLLWKVPVGKKQGFIVGGNDDLPI